MRPSCEMPIIGALSSVVAHLACLIVLALMLQPLGPGNRARLEIELAAAEEVVPLDSVMLQTLPTPVPLTAAQAAPTPPRELPPLHFASDLLPALSPAPSGSDAARRFASSGHGAGTGPAARFFGSTIYGDRFVYLLDMSFSMDEMGASPGEGTRFERAQQELLRSVDRLTEDQQFYVMLFCYHTLRMYGDPSPVPQMLPATRAHQQLLRSWLKTVRTGPGTDPREGLKLALEMQPSGVFLLSDGEFNGHQHRNPGVTFRGNPSVFAIVQATNAQNTPIHAIAYENPVGKSTMQSLAARTGGSFQFIPATDLRDQEAPNSATARREEVAASLVRQAGDMLQAGDHAAALRLYRRAAVRFPATVAGRSADGHLQRLRAKLNARTAKK